MIIPVRCNCGKKISDKYELYKEMVSNIKLNLNKDPNEPSLLEVNSNELKKTPEGEVLDKLGFIRYCCRKIFLTHIELIDEI
tara:strand:- start:251 stop:496 length:246 start_codon:yes stop_codon:yes gene_type:complete